jgi:hypothetical protein
LPKYSGVAEVLERAAGFDVDYTPAETLAEKKEKEVFAC